MKNEHETGAGVEHKSAKQPTGSAPASLEAAYDRLTGYGFARRYVEGSVVADIGWGEVGYGTRLLADSAMSVVGLTNLPEAAERASTAYSAPNVGYQRADLPELPFPQGYFDVVVALGIVENLEHPEDLIRETKRVLKQDGLLLISAVDKQIRSNERNLSTFDDRREMYLPEFCNLLERSFRHVRLYRQGVVAGGYVFPASGEASGMVVESAHLSSTTPSLSKENPLTHSVIAVCSGIEASSREQPYLLLDRDRRVFDECEERAEDVELLRDEIQLMQETEVQALITTLQYYESKAEKAGRGLLHVRNLVYGAKRRLFKSRRQSN